MTFQELNKKNINKIYQWFFNNKNDIIKKASYPRFIPVSEQIAMFKNKNNITTFESNETLARILTWNI